MQGTRSAVALALLSCLPSGLAEAATSSPSLRLPGGAAPVRYAVELTVDPTTDRLSGVIDIEVEVSRPLETLWLNGTELLVSSASIGASPARVIPSGKDFLALAIGRQILPGRHRVHLEYSAPISSVELGGASRQSEHGDWYAFTHFEPIDARRVFPCFDEPSFKVPWNVALKVRARDRAFSNARELDEVALPGGWKRVRFAETRPLPSYLVAIAVGPMDVVEVGRSSRSGTPIRLIVPRGQGGATAWARQTAVPLLERLEEYFGSNYPYDKLDFVAVPRMGGGMEHPGLITYGAANMLRRPEDESIEWRRGWAGLAAHELAHMWFGDLVTMAWWDDLWLNEAFASWLPLKILDAWQPTWDVPSGGVLSRNGAMVEDGLVHARRIRQPISSNDDMKNAFDAITYRKGASVISMFERFVGAEAFRRGVQRHMKAHAHGTATTGDFIRAISAAAAADVAPAFASFLDQPGVPLVSFALDCEHGARLRLRQERYLPLGSTGKRDEGRWQVPVCARWPGGGACTLLSGREGELELDHCPAWIAPNADGRGYYRARLDGDLLTRLDGGGLASLTAPEKLALVSDLLALVRSGELPLSELLELAPRLAVDSSRQVVGQLLDVIGGLRDAELVAPAHAAAYAAYLRRTFGARARALGWRARRGDDEDQRLVRQRLVPLLAGAGEDGALRAQALAAAHAWLSGRGQPDGDMIDAILEAAAWTGERRLFDRLLGHALAEEDLTRRLRLLRALAAFRDPALVTELLPLLLDPRLDTRESIAFLGGAMRHPQGRRLAWAWLQAHFDALIARLPRSYPAALGAYAAAVCDPAEAGAIERFLEARVRPHEGGPRRAAQASEQLRLCLAYREAQAPAVARFFARRSGRDAGAAR